MVQYRVTSFGAACVKLCGLPPPALDRITVAAVSSSLQRRKYKVGFDLNTKIKPLIIFSDRVDKITPTFAAHHRRFDRAHKSRLASRETGDGLTGAHSGGSLDRTESVPKWSRTRRACAGLMEASRRDKTIRSWSLNLRDASASSRS